MDSDLQKTLKDISRRLQALEAAVTAKPRATAPSSSKQKAKTLPELARNTQIVNGQHKVVLIVGYYEKILNKSDITKQDIKEGWKDGKFSGSFANMLLFRAIKDGLIRDLKNNTYDLSQSGEDLFGELTAQ